MPSVLQQKGFHRDREIMELIQSRLALDTEQVRVIVFKGQKYGLRKAQERSKKLHDKSKLNRWRPGPECSYIYFPGKKHGRIEHLVMLNWVYCWMVWELKSWESIYRWDYEQDYGALQCDAFVAVKNTVTGKLSFSFVELDRAESGNSFDKVKKYCELYENGKYNNWWWVEQAEKFPEIIIVTTSQARERVIRRQIGRENRSGLRFSVYLLDQVKRKVVEK